MALIKPGRRPYAEREMNIRVFIIDEHTRARQMLARRLSSLPGLEVVGMTCDGARCLRQIEELRPDVVLLDTKMKRANGMDICRQICSANGGSKVAVLTSYMDPDERRLAYQAGVSGYILKEVDTPNLARWINLLVGTTGPDPASPTTSPTRGGGVKRIGAE